MNKQQKKSTKHTVRSAFDLFPTDPGSQAILAKRSLRIAKKEVRQAENRHLIDYVKLTLGPRENYGISFYSIKEIMNKINITPLPCVPDYVAGVMNKRGLLISVIDLKKFFCITGENVDKRHGMIIVAHKNMTVGLLTGEIKGSDQYDLSEMNNSTFPTGVIKPEYVLGLHNGVTAILRIDKILEALETEFQLSDKLK